MLVNNALVEQYAIPLSIVAFVLKALSPIWKHFRVLQCIKTSMMKKEMEVKKEKKQRRKWQDQVRKNKEEIDLFFSLNHLN